MQVWVCSRARDIVGLYGPRLKRLLGPSLIDFHGNPGVWALYQAIGIPTPNIGGDLGSDRLQLGRRTGRAVPVSVRTDPVGKGAMLRLVGRRAVFFAHFYF